ncbi:polyphenol oxidase family protein [Erwinia sp. BC051422]|jgi:YfiH family protein|uniref:polyphenol oxidase family protein n=1 Tax=Erwinia TaxID=551 RepID=UPI00263A70CC|nr:MULTISPECIES: polyphenol oxidase family protein [unclassified Erwinia]MDN4628933.1 polyphenol oxidase family protein [Erwinia sp. PsM31]MDN8542068.1 polyphenol oxidase family protein [Erwinia sp. BC051422]
MPHAYHSTLLSSLAWLDHAFQPAGEPPPPESIMNRQRHTANVLLSSEALPVKSHEADGLIATDLYPVAVYTADCLPVLIADVRQKQVAAVHAGLNGALKGVLIQAIHRLCERGATPDSLYLAVGPSIGPCCYELGEDRIAAMRQENPHDLRPLLAYSTRQYRNPQAVRAQAIGTTQGVWFDLPLLAKRMAMRAGVPEAQIELSGICTYCMAEEQASYRRNGHFQHGYQQRYAWIRRR